MKFTLSLILLLVLLPVLSADVSAETNSTQSKRRGFAGAADRCPGQGN